MEPHIFYPLHEDVEWLAVDQDGLIARFTTGGMGPIPRSALLQQKTHRRLSETIDKNAPRCVGEVVVGYSDSTDFRSCSERGIFAYDWSDVHRVRATAIHAYELIARPTAPLTVSWLGEEFSDVEEALPRFPLSFREVLLAPLVTEMEWIRP